MRIFTKKTLTIVMFGLSLLGCAAISTSANHGSLVVESKMSNSIFLEPIAADKQTVYVQVHNTSSEDLTGISSGIKTRLMNAGWVVVNDPAKAHDMIQVNVLQFGQAKDPDEVKKSVDNGFGSVMTGALAGVVAGAATGSGTTGLAVGAGVAAVSFLADTLVTDKTYSLITDVQISVKSNGKVKSATVSSLSQGSSSTEAQSSTSEASYMKYRTRIASYADQVNLKFEKAKPLLINQLTKEVSGILAGDE